MAVQTFNLSCLLYDPHDARFENREVPTITDPHDVIIRIAYVGVCGSDVSPCNEQKARGTMSGPRTNTVKKAWTDGCHLGSLLAPRRSWPKGLPCQPLDNGSRSLWYCPQHWLCGDHSFTQRQCLHRTRTPLLSLQVMQVRPLQSLS
jgi:hypothetical protein